MPRVTEVKKARKDQGTCCRCRKEIKAGDAYKWIAQRFGPRYVACIDCSFLPSHMSSSKMTSIWDEQVMLDFSGCEKPEDIRSMLEDFASTVRMVADEYQESADNISSYFTESEKAQEMEEKAQELMSWADEIENPEFLDEEYEYDSSSEMTKIEQYDQYMEEMRTHAADAISNCPVD